MESAREREIVSGEESAYRGWCAIMKHLNPDPIMDERGTLLGAAATWTDMADSLAVAVALMEVNATVSK